MQFQYFLIQSTSFYQIYSKPETLAPEAAQYNLVKASFVVKGCSISCEATSVALAATSLAIESHTFLTIKIFLRILDPRMPMFSGLRFRKLVLFMLLVHKLL
jgi:hypothetical protein